MDAGSRGSEIAGGLPWHRALLVWMLIMLAESVHGVAREIFVAPHLGDLRARQLGVPLGCLIIFLVAWASARWLNVASRRELLIVGALWVVLTLGFEILLGRALSLSWTRILSDYNPARGGLMALGLIFMGLAPLLAARLRHLNPEKS